MASHPLLGHQSLPDISVFNYHEHHIQGKMLAAALTFSEEEIMAMGKTVIKEKMAKLLAQAILESGCIEFTQMAMDPIHSTKTIHARCFLVPDTQVKILRELRK